MFSSVLNEGEDFLEKALCYLSLKEAIANHDSLRHEDAYGKDP